MKKVFTKLVIVLIIPAVYFILAGAFSTGDKNKSSNEELSSPPSSGQKDFVNMIMNCDWFNCDRIWIGDHINKYKELGYNSVHVYPWSNSVYGKFEESYTPDQIALNTDLIDAVHTAPLKFFYEQIKLSKPCYAQKIEYTLPPNEDSHSTNNGFCFQNVMNSNLLMSDGVKWIIHPVAGVNNAGYLCDSIYENLQQSDFFSRQMDNGNWYLYPTVKIKQEDYQNNPGAPVFAICIRNFKGKKSSSVDSLIFYTNDFGENGPYGGDYIELHKHLFNALLNVISGDTTISGLNYGVADTNYMHNYGLADRCKVDFKIYWYGQVDFWFEKLITLDDDGHELFYNSQYDGIIDNELDVIGSQQNLYSYSMDEVTYSQLPAIKHVMEKINNFNPNIKFLVSESNWMAHNKMRNVNWGHQLTLQYLQPKTINVFAPPLVFERPDLSGSAISYK